MDEPKIKEENVIREIKVVNNSIKVEKKIVKEGS